MSAKAETAEARIKKNSRSSIWRHFEPTSKTTAKCLLCQQTYRNSGNTTNLMDHLRRKHKDKHTELMKNSKENSTIVIPLTITRMEDELATADAAGTVETIKYEPEDQAEEVESAQLEISEESSTLITSEVVEQEGILEEEAAHLKAGQIVADIKSGNLIIETDEGQHEMQMCKIVPLPHARSEVWTYFGFVADQEGQILDRTKVVCRLCSSSFCYSGNTTNFYSHLKSMHSEVQIRSVPVKNSRSVKRTYSSMSNNNDNADDADYLNDTTNTTSSGVHSRLSQHEVALADDEAIPPRSRSDLIHVDDITQSIVDFLVTDCRPVAVTQGKGFHQMLRLLAPGYTLPDKAKLAQSVRRKYELMRTEREQGVIDRMSTMDY